MRVERTAVWIAVTACIVGVAAGLAGCKRKPTPEASPPEPTPTGRCENVDLEGASCRLRNVVVTNLDPGRADGKVVQVSHAADVGGTEYSFNSLTVVVPEARIGELRALLREHSPVRCEGLIVRPPCNPDGTAVKLELKLPDYVKPYR